MRLNTAPKFTEKTHEGAQASRMTDLQALRRSVASCLLWEREFYEDGQEVADRIVSLAQKVSPSELSALAIEARESFKLRHVPLLLASVLAKTGSGSVLVSETISRIIQRADELAEFFTVYAKVNGVTSDKLKPVVSAQVKKGVAKAFQKFDEYHLAKYDRAGAVRLRDALFLSHAKPKDDEQAELWQKLIDGKLDSPDTWEVALSGGADKKEVFERLLRENKLGYLALLRNLRNMDQSGVEEALVRDAILARKGADRVLPFRFIAAARAAPRFEKYLDHALIAGLTQNHFDGKTVVMVDVSGSMDCVLSSKSDLRRVDAACALASVINGDVRVFSFSNAVVEVPHRLGMAGVDAIIRSQPHSGTYLGQALELVNKSVAYDRIIVITDEQVAGRSVPDPIPKSIGYMINVASNKNGIGYGSWLHIDGFSESVLRFIAEHERN